MSTASHVHDADGLLGPSTFRALVDSMRDGFAIQDMDGVLVYANDRLCEMTGYSREEAIGKRSTLFMDDYNAEILMRHMKRGRNGVVSDEYELVITRSDGSPLHTIVAPAPIRNAEGERIGSCAVIKDITERKRTEQQLVDAVGRLQSVNSALTRILRTVDSLIARSDLDGLLQEIVLAAQDALGFRTVLVSLVDRETGEVRMAANVGLDAEEKRLVEEPTVRMTWQDFEGILEEKYRTGSCYFIPHGEIDWHSRFDYSDPGDPGGAEQGHSGSIPVREAWHPDDALLCLIRTSAEETQGVISVDGPENGLRPDLGTLQCLEIFADLAAVSIQNSRLYEKLEFELDERTAAEASLQEARTQLQARIEERTEELRRANESLREEIDRGREVSESLRVSEERYRTLHDNIPVGVFRSTADPGGHLLTANRALARMFGYDSPEDMSNVTVAELYAHPEDRKGFIESMAESDEVMGYDAEFRKRQGSLFWGSLTARAIRDESGEVAYFDGILEDVTDRKDAEEALRVSEQRFRELFENSIIGVYRTTPDGRMVMANPAMVDMLGYESFEELSTINLEGQLYFPDYPRSQFKSEVESAGRVIGLEATWRKKDGTKLFIRESSVAVRGPDGSVLYYAGTVEDITERKMAEQALQESELRYRTLFESARDAIFMMVEDMFIDCNPQTLVMFGLSSRDQIIGQPPYRFSPPTQPDGRDSREKARENIGAAAGGEALSFEWVHCRLDGTPFYAEVSLNRLVLDGDIKIQAIVRDITERKKAEVELERLARTDYLTGLNNRLYFMERLAEEFDRSRRYKSPLAMMILDLDRFKQINDNHGHLVGDRVLAGVARIMTSTLRKCDIVGRYGGEEFCAVLPETALDGATTLAERLRNRFEAWDATEALREATRADDSGGGGNGETELRVTCSIGVAVLDENMKDTNDLLREADDNLYLAKQGGRNRVCARSGKKASESS